jgi:hypothetical protein
MLGFDAARTTWEVLYGVGIVLVAVAGRMTREGSGEWLNCPVCQNFAGGGRGGRAVAPGQEVLGQQLACMRLTVFFWRTEPHVAYMPRAGWLFRTRAKDFSAHSSLACASAISAFYAQNWQFFAHDCKIAVCWRFSNRNRCIFGP